MARAQRPDSVWYMPTTPERRLLRLRDAAEKSRPLHYAPYSGVMVLAAAELVSGTIAGGSNIEIINFSLTKHAEEVAVMNAFVADGEPPRQGHLAALYIAGAAPCGSCRQFAAEFASDAAIWIVDRISQSEIQREGSLLELPPSREPVVKAFGELFPFPFSPAHHS